MADKFGIVLHIGGSPAEEMANFFAKHCDLEGQVGSEGGRITFKKVDDWETMARIHKIVFEPYAGELIQNAANIVVKFVKKYCVHDHCRSLWISFNGVMVPVYESPEEIVGYYYGFIDGSQKK